MTNWLSGQLRQQPRVAQGQLADCYPTCQHDVSVLSRHTHARRKLWLMYHCSRFTDMPKPLQIHRLLTSYQCRSITRSQPYLACAITNLVQDFRASHLAVCHKGPSESRTRRMIHHGSENMSLFVIQIKKGCLFTIFSFWV